MNSWRYAFFLLVLTVILLNCKKDDDIIQELQCEEAYQFDEEEKQIFIYVLNYTSGLPKHEIYDIQGSLLCTVPNLSTDDYGRNFVIHNDIIYTGDSNNIYTINPITCSFLDTFEVQEGQYLVTFPKDDRLVYAIERELEIDFYVKYLSNNNPDKLFRTIPNTCNFTTKEINGKLFLSNCSDDYKVEIYDIENPNLSATIESHVELDRIDFDKDYFYYDASNGDDLFLNARRFSNLELIWTKKISGYGFKLIGDKILTFKENEEENSFQVEVLDYKTGQTIIEWDSNYTKPFEFISKYNLLVSYPTGLWTPSKLARLDLCTGETIWEEHEIGYNFVPRFKSYLAQQEIIYLPDNETATIKHVSTANGEVINRTFLPTNNDGFSILTENFYD